MISKGLRGGRLGGLVRYLFGPGRHEEHVNQRVVASSDPTWVGTTRPDAQTLRQLIAEMDEPMTRHGEVTTGGYVYHVVASIPQTDGLLSDEQWQASAQVFAAKLGLDETVSWLAIHHGPSANGNDHIHLVVNLIRDDGRAVNLWQDRVKRRAACLELEERFGLAGTAPAGLGQGSLSRREVEAVRAGQVASVVDLGRHRVATVVRAVAAGSRSEQEFVTRLRGEGLVVRPRLDKADRGQVVGYSVAERSGPEGGRLVWYGGGTLSKDLRLPALRARWGQGPDERRDAAAAWSSSSTSPPARVEPRDLVGAAEALRKASGLLERMQYSNVSGWAAMSSESAGLLAAAAAAVGNDGVRRELIRAWKSVHLAEPVATHIGLRTAPGDAGGLAAQRRDSGLEPVVTAWPGGEEARAGVQSGQAATLLGGVSRVLLASGRSGRTGAGTAQARALVVQAVELAAQIARTLAAQREASEAQQRAVLAVARAQEAVAGLSPAGSWGFTRSGAEVLAARRAVAGQAPASGGSGSAPSPRPSRDPGVDPDLNR